VYRPVGSNGRGCVDNVSIDARGSPTIFCIMRYCWGRSASMGRTFFAMGLYFFFVAAKVARGARSQRAGSHGSKVLRGKVENLEGK